MQLNDQNYCHAVLHEREANTLIGEYLKKDQPFLVSKAANIACEIASSVILKQQPIAEHLKIQALVNMGVFPNTEENLQKFAYNYVESITNIDIMGIWAVPDYDWLVNTYCPQAHYTRLWGMEPYHFPNPWSANLENKTVLVIHPFEESIKNNYSNREKLFQNLNVLPKFDLKTIKAEQNLSNTNSNYFESIKRMQDKISSIDFDIAIVGCGASGLPISSFIKKELHRTAIHMGGATQILFGIIGRRWEAYPQIRKLINEYWTRPLPEEIPKSAMSVEGGCYW
jgi:predicted DNA binding CopG/RHH family protein